jgi:hypothetical protein
MENLHRRLVAREMRVPTKPETELQKHHFPTKEKKRKKGIFTKKLIEVL